MQQRFAIMCRPDVAYARYAQSEFARENAGALLALRDAFPFLDSAHYRGISRRPLQAMLPPDSVHRRNLERAGIDFRNDARARVKLAELGVPAAENDPWAEQEFPPGAFCIIAIGAG